jgi:predicted transcriptional regulator
MPKGDSHESAVLTVRVTADLNRRLERAARTRRRTRSETAREILEAALAGTAVEDPAVEAKRQSKLASKHRAADDVTEFITTAADLRGWK